MISPSRGVGIWGASCWRFSDSEESWSSHSLPLGNRGICIGFGVADQQQRRVKLKMCLYNSYLVFSAIYVEYFRWLLHAVPLWSHSQHVTFLGPFSCGERCPKEHTRLKSQCWLVTLYIIRIDTVSQSYPNVDWLPIIIIYNQWPRYRDFGLLRPGGTQQQPRHPYIRGAMWMDLVLVVLGCLMCAKWEGTPMYRIILYICVCSLQHRYVRILLTIQRVSSVE